MLSDRKSHESAFQSWRNISKPKNGNGYFCQGLKRRADVNDIKTAERWTLKWRNEGIIYSKVNHQVPTNSQNHYITLPQGQIHRSWSHRWRLEILFLEICWLWKGNLRIFKLHERKILKKIWPGTPKHCFSQNYQRQFDSCV